MFVWKLKFEKITVNHDYLQICVLLNYLQKLVIEKQKEKERIYVYPQMTDYSSIHLMDGAVTIFSLSLTSSWIFFEAAYPAIGGNEHEKNNKIWNKLHEKMN